MDLFFKLSKIVFIKILTKFYILGGHTQQCSGVGYLWLYTQESFLVVLRDAWGSNLGHSCARKVPAHCTITPAHLYFLLNFFFLIGEIIQSLKCFGRQLLWLRPLIWIPGTTDEALNTRCGHKTRQISLILGPYLKQEVAQGLFSGGTMQYLG